jgi:heptaprenyl diphosphate synthase
MQYHNKIALTGILASITIVLGIVEAMLPSPFPGVRLGLANIGIMLAIYALSFNEVIQIAILKSILIPILTGNFFIKIMISFPSTIIATLVMYIYYRLTRKYSTPISTAALGAFVHINIQFIVVKLTIIKSLAIYNVLPYFSILSIISGIITGYIVYRVVDNFENRFKNIKNGA